MKSYKNILGQNITLQQLNQLEEYILETIDDNTGEVKTIETTRMVRESQTKSYDYFLEISEDKNIVIQQFMANSLFKGISIYENKSNVFGFTAYDVEDYNIDGILYSKSKHVYDSSNRIILHCSLDLQTNEIITSDTPAKYYYGTQNDLPDLVLKFTYEFDQVTNQFKTYVLDVNQSTVHFNTLNQLNFIDVFGQDFWDNHPYYHSLLPLFPTSANL